MSPSWRELHQTLGPRLFWRSLLWGFTRHAFPRKFDPAAEAMDRHRQLQAQEYFGEKVG